MALPQDCGAFKGSDDSTPLIWRPDPLSLPCSYRVRTLRTRHGVSPETAALLAELFCQPHSRHA